MIHIINIFMKWSRSSAKLWEDLLFLRRVCRRWWQTPLWFVYHISNIRHQLAWLLFLIHCQLTSKKDIEKPPHAKVQQLSVEDVKFFSTRRVMMCGCRAIYGKTCWWCWKWANERAESSSMWMSRRHRSRAASSSRALGCEDVAKNMLTLFFLRLLCWISKQVNSPFGSFKLFIFRNHLHIYNDGNRGASSAAEWKNFS